jgi:hypothetical protein
MYLLDLHSDDALRPEARRFKVERNDESLRKWTLLPACPGNGELLRHAALVCCGHPFLQRLPAEPDVLAGRHGSRPPRIRVFQPSNRLNRRRNRRLLDKSSAPKEDNYWTICPVVD